jgi:hypothetical protein
MKTKKNIMAQSFTNIDLLCVSGEHGEIVTLEHDDVTCIIYKALKESGNPDRLLALNLADKVIYRLKSWKDSKMTLTIHDVEYMVRFVLNEAGNNQASRSVGIDSNTINQYN